MSPPTPEQAAALAAISAGGDTAIAAGAGAGKTTLLVEAVWRDVERDGVPVERLLVAAYNRAAAAHLVARLQARFSDPDDGRGADRVGLDLSAGWVGTFHSLAARIVREQPFLAGVDPEFTELDETDSAALMEQALDRAFEATTHEGLLEIVVNSRSAERLRQATVHCHDTLRAAGHERPRITVPPPADPDPASIERLGALAAEIAAHAGCRDDHREGLAELAVLLDSAQPGDAPPKLKRNCAHALKPLVEELNGLAEAVWTAYGSVEATRQLEGFAAYLADVSDRYAAAKRERGALDYEDLLLAARRVLESGAHAVRFDRVYVDEFQDANALQSRIVDLLGGGRTVVVGDGAQAVYGFRHADSAHFAGRVGATPGATLRDNHRTQAPLMAALNDVLSEVLAGEPTFAPLTPVAAERPDAPPLADRPLRVVDVRSDDGERATREQEAEAVADAVAATIAHGYRPSDVAVLFRAMTEVEAFRAAIAGRGIPVHLVAGRGFLTHDQVADVIALLALVENPYDEESLVRVLCSPYVSLSDGELIELRRAAGSDTTGWPDAGALWPALDGSPTGRTVARTVSDLRPMLRERGLAGLVEAAISARGYDLAVLGLPDGARRYANLRRLVGLAASHAAVRGPDLRGFLALMRWKADAGNQDPGEAVLVDPDLDAVRLATVHSVKGQEFPVVVIADGSHARPGGGPMVRVDARGVAGIAAPRAGGKAIRTADYERLAGAAAAADGAEERRVLYVAATRAERHLAVLGRSTARGAVADAPFQLVSGADRVDVEEVEVATDPAADERPRVVPSDPTEVAAPTTSAPPVVDPVGGRRRSFSALETFTTCRRRFHLEVELGLRGRDDAVVAGGGGEGGAPSAWGGTAFGDLVHRALAAHDWEGPAPAPGWAAGMAGASGLAESPLDAGRAERLVAGLLAHPMAARIRDARDRHAERPFTLAAEGVLVGGAIDLLVDEGGGRALVCDWKTHDLTGRSAADVSSGYALQRTVYALAALEAGFTEVTLWWAFLEDLAGSPVETVAAADRERLHDRLAAALAEIRADTDRAPAATTAQPFCTGCPGLDAFCPVAGAMPQGPQTYR